SLRFICWPPSSKQQEQRATRTIPTVTERANFRELFSGFQPPYSQWASLQLMFWVRFSLGWTRANLKVPTCAAQALGISSRLTLFRIGERSKCAEAYAQ